MPENPETLEDLAAKKRRVKGRAPQKPSRKPRLRTVYDKQLVVAGTNTNTFFPANPNDNTPDNNYQTNPFNPAHETVIHGVSVEIVEQCIRIADTSSITPADVLNMLADSVLEISRGTSNDKVLQIPTSRILDLRGVTYAMHGTADGPEVAVVPPPRSIVHFKTPLVIPKGQRVTVKITFKGTTGIPANLVNLRLSLRIKDWED